MKAVYEGFIVVWDFADKVPNKDTTNKAKKEDEANEADDDDEANEADDSDEANEADENVEANVANEGDETDNVPNNNEGGQQPFTEEELEFMMQLHQTGDIAYETLTQEQLDQIFAAQAILTPSAQQSSSAQGNNGRDFYGFPQDDVPGPGFDQNYYSDEEDYASQLPPYIGAPADTSAGGPAQQQLVQSPVSVANGIQDGEQSSSVQAAQIASVQGPLPDAPMIVDTSNVEQAPTAQTNPTEAGEQSTSAQANNVEGDLQADSAQTSNPTSDVSWVDEGDAGW